MLGLSSTISSFEAFFCALWYSEYISTLKVFFSKVGDLLKLAPVGEYFVCCLAIEGVSFPIKFKSWTFLREKVKGSSYSVTGLMALSLIRIR
jgi:hypothetical protein